MRQKGLSFIKGFLFLLLVTLIDSTGFVTTNAQAAEKPSIQADMEIGIGSTGYWNDASYELFDYTLEVYSPVNKATYSFTTSNKSVVTVKTKGNKAYLTGVKVGKATITCNQKLKGKTTKIGTCKVTVKDVKAYGPGYGSLPIGTNTAMLVEYTNRNNDATYTFTSDSKNFTMKEKVETTEDGWIYVVQTYTAKKPGKYKVTVKETYKNKTRNIGKLEYVVEKATINPEASMYVGDVFWAFELISNYRTDVNYRFVSSDDSIAESYVSEDTVYYKGLKPGTVEVKIYEDASETKLGELIGSSTLTVKELKIESLDGALSTDSTYVGGGDVELYIYKDPYNAPEEVIVTSSDTKIATVGKVDENNMVLITPVSEGTVTITYTCGELTNTATLTIFADEDDYYEHIYD